MINQNESKINKHHSVKQHWGMIIALIKYTMYLYLINDNSCIINYCTSEYIIEPPIQI